MPDAPRRDAQTFLSIIPRRIYSHPDTRVISSSSFPSGETLLIASLHRTASTGVLSPCETTMRRTHTYTRARALAHAPSRFDSLNLAHDAFCPRT